MPVNFYLQTGNGENFLSWDLVSTATSYSVQRSTDGVTFTAIATPASNQYLDITSIVATNYYYQVAAINGSGTGPYTPAQSIISTLPGSMSLGQMRLNAKQKADMINSNFVTLPEWNTYISNSYKELYDILIQKYGDDYYYTVPCSYITTGTLDANSQAQTFPLPNGLSTTDALTNVAFTGTLTAGNTTISSIGSGVTSNLAKGMGINGVGIVPGSRIDSVASTSIVITIAPTGNGSTNITAGRIVPAFYKLMLCEVALNPQDPNSWITLKKYQRIQQNLWNFPNVYTFYGITNLRYRITGAELQVVPISQAGQTIRIHYAPRPKTLFRDTDTVDGVSGWEEYILVDAAIKALQKEESDAGVLMAQKKDLLMRIEAAATNRDAGEPDTVSDSRTRNFSWGDSGGEFSSGSGTN